MTAEPDLLPLRDWMECLGEINAEDIRDYARANVAHATATLQAEVEALRAEVARLRRSLHEAVVHGNRQSGRAERLAEALHRLEEACDDSDGAQYGTLGTSFVRGICKDALLREQEEGK